VPRELLAFFAAFLIGICTVSGILLLLLIWAGRIREHNIERTEKRAEQARADAWAGFDKARHRHPLPAAHSDLEALEVEGPVYVHQPEVVGEMRRAS
jgi:hypothetical protein